MMSSELPSGRWWEDPLPDAALRLSYRTPDELTGLRDAAARFAWAAGMAARLVPQMVLAVSELATNTMRHTAGPGAVQLWVTHDGLMVQVSDSGTLPAAVAAGPFSFPSQPAVGGYGLALAAKFSDQMHVRAAPTLIRLLFLLR
jgi:anti-sigma regulatory factor (Ser/Thr protein kinase)